MINSKRVNFPVKGPIMEANHRMKVNHNTDLILVSILDTLDINLPQEDTTLILNTAKDKESQAVILDSMELIIAEMVPRNPRRIVNNSQ